MKKNLKMGIVLMFMLFVLTGCTNTEYNVKVKRNGTGKTEYSVEFDKEKLDEMVNKDSNEESQKIDGIEWIQSFNVFSVLMNAAEKNGYNVEEIKKDGNTLGYKASKEFNNIAEEFKIQDSVGEEYIIIENDSGIKVEKGIFITKYTQSFTADLSKAGEVINKVKLSYNFPKGITKSNADDKSSLFSSTLTWNLGKNEVKKIEYTVYSFNISLIIIIIIAIVIAVVIIYIIMKKIKKSNQENNNLAGKNVK